MFLHKRYNESFSFEVDFIAHLKKAIEIDHNTFALFILGLYYRYEVNDVEESDRYWRIAIHYGTIPAILMKARYYKEKKEYEKMTECYLQTLEFGRIDGLMELIEFHQEKENLVEAIYYIKMLDEIKKNN